ncbi:isoprenoid biosynthesis glyoxalase ElbB [Puniceicoccales bacterium CK1056]|uniref:Isoprenoid biosynthesis glyoxalase ElbB n=1 Tax=Oceanipulchritudo coccoides TaxID=2706888 RepID=A0A6B2M2K7_9BACT|nr:isoprenoid biosynthesis glyoxalase ElbB [Oceanipulchritudo coccoides]NDV63251.1 isoprenoid biosynthesis glyoxalase ElbB [Oceanipulchritudo coccoides]
MKKRVGVILSGCGFLDGAEIYESVLTLIALEKAGLEAVCMAPDVEQHHVINHLTGNEVAEKRNVLVEAARIARGNIKNIAEITGKEIDALILPGGYGAAKNLCSFAIDGPKGKVNPEVRRLVRDIFAARKPMGFICISPAVGAMVLGETGVELTIGDDPGTAEAIESLGAHHVNCSVSEIHMDPDRKIVSTPAYMLGQNILEVSSGIEKLVQCVAEWIQ